MVLSKRKWGIAAQSYLNGTIYGTANVETTSALLLAYDEELIIEVRYHPFGQAVVLIALTVLVGMISIIYFVLRDQKKVRETK